MTLSLLRPTLIAATILVLSLCALSCSDGDGKRTPDTVINIGVDGGTLGCIQPIFPPDQPDLTLQSPPIFLLTGNALQSTVGQAQASPGDAIPAEVTVNAATRQVKVELANAYAPDRVIFTDEAETGGNETVGFTLMSTQQTRGRFFMRITLCGRDCDARHVVFEQIECPEERGAEPCGVNGPYERTLIEEGEVARVDGTCVDLGSTPNVGSGTILIQ